MKKKDVIAQILAYTFATMFFVILYYAARKNLWLWGWYGWIFGSVGAANLVYLIVRLFACPVIPARKEVKGRGRFWESSREFD